jgi:hypothetical protein
MKRPMFFISLAAVSALLCGQAAPSSCTSATVVTSAICIDASALQGAVALNSNQQAVLTGIIATCAATNGGTRFANDTIVKALIADALLLQQSGLLSAVHIKAEAPDAQMTLRKIKAHWAGIPELRASFK